MDLTDLDHAIQNKVDELSKIILSPSTPLEVTTILRHQRHTLLAVERAIHERNAREIDLTI